MKFVQFFFFIMLVTPLCAQDYNHMTRHAFTDATVIDGLRYNNCDSILVIDYTSLLRNEKADLPDGRVWIVKTDANSQSRGNKIEYSYNLDQGACEAILVTKISKKGHKITLQYKCPSKDRAGKFVFIYRKRRFVLVERELGHL